MTSYNNYNLSYKIEGRMFGAKVGFDKSVLLKMKKPFYKISKHKHDAEIIKLFINAVTNDGIDDAQAYLSKELKAIGTLNYEELKKIFNKNIEYKYLSNVRFLNMPKNIATSSILIMNNEIKNNSIVHLYMVREPDHYGNWKICGIEKE